MTTIPGEFALFAEPYRGPSWSWVSVDASVEVWYKSWIDEDAPDEVRVQISY